MRSLQRRLFTDTRYVLLGFPAAVILFAAVVGGVAAGLGSAVAFVGLPILAATAALARNLADIERVMLPGVLGYPVGHPGYTRAPAGASWFRRVMNPLTSGQAVMDLLHGIIAFPFAVASFVLVTVWWAGAVAGLTFPLYGWAVAAIPGSEVSLPALLGIGDDDVLFVGFYTVAGLLFALTLVPVVRMAALLKASVAQVLLTRATPAAVQRTA
ncbi:sensor domain-containing protein [Nonomuraea sp. NPDC002799]